MNPLKGLKVNGGKTDACSGLVRRTIEKLIMLDDDEVVDTRGLCKDILYCNYNTFSHVQADPAFDGYRIQVGWKLFWGNRTAIATIVSRLNKATNES